MMNGLSYDASKVAAELREQLASDKRRLGFFIGAGTSMSVGVPGIVGLTEEVDKKLEKKQRGQFNWICTDIGGKPNVEDVLNRIRLYRELLDDDEKKNHSDLTGKAAKELDAAICMAIYEIVSVDPPKGMTPHRTFAQWLNACYAGRVWPVEIFTTNYDLLIENAMEQVGVPYFDGFVGSVAPSFAPECVEADNTRDCEAVCPPRSWTRLWKMHGSVNWYVRRDEKTGKKYVTRLSGVNPRQGEELMVFPSREKYVASRKLPFLAYQDRLRRFVSSGESVLFVIGYNFSDEHLNEIIFQGLRGNNRLAVNVLMHGDKKVVDGKDRLTLPQTIEEYGRTYRNMSIYGPDKSVVGGVPGGWGSFPHKKDDPEPFAYWSDEEKRFTLGEFNAFTAYLERFIGFRSVTFARTYTDVSLKEGGK